MLRFPLGQVCAKYTYRNTKSKTEYVKQEHLEKLLDSAALLTMIG